MSRQTKRQAELWRRRDATIRALHAQRRALVSLMRRGGLSPVDAIRLESIEAKLDRLELAEDRDRRAGRDGPTACGCIVCHIRSKAAALAFAEGQRQLQADISAMVERCAKSLLATVAPKSRKRRPKK